MKIKSIGSLIFLAFIIPISASQMYFYSLPETKKYTSANYLVFYSDTYEKSRDKFKVAVNKLKSSPVLKSSTKFDYRKIPLTNQTKVEEFDLLHLNSNSDELLVISSGLHGVEGFVGSALQTYLLDSLGSGKFSKIANKDILVLHGLNPFGFRNKLRINQNNVDLNRAFISSKVIQDQQYLKKIANIPYKKLNSILNPKTKLKSGKFRTGVSFIPFITRVLSSLFSMSFSELREAILKGQYEFPKGLYYGGRGGLEQQKILEDLLPNLLQPYKKITFFDIHTGYGDRNKLHLITSKNITPQSANDLSSSVKIINDNFKDNIITVEDSDTDGFYETNGDFLEFLVGLAPKSAQITPIVLEFGTMNNHTTLGGLKSLYIMVKENQIRNYGVINKDTKQIIDGLYLELYYPSNSKWRNNAMFLFTELLNT